MDLHHLRLVAEICERGSIGKAAQTLGVSQPTLSKTLARLEDQLGQVLFQRGRGGSATPTIFATHISARAREILRWSDQLAREVELLAGGEVGRVRMGIGPGAKALLMPELVTKILTRFPNLHLDVDVLASDELYDRLISRQLDLVVGHFSPLLDFPDMRVLPLVDEPGSSIVRADHPLTKIANITWQDSLNYPHVSTVRYKTYAPYFSEGLPAGAEQILTTVRTSDMECAHRLVEEMDFVALASQLVFRSDLQSGRFVTLPLPRRYHSACSVAVTDEAAHFPVVRGIIDLVRQGLEKAGLELLS
ncbi:LysR family transcriptional regulator [Henriciella litoralis]|uniref:LysR family transcriptional regulator n=1 Tax=Henriciella litoralis TaxID=568102 RepID=UPI00146E7355|nr:LysR family transcriptional regulator [Henriciella litoralis]